VTSFRSVVPMPARSVARPGLRLGLLASAQFIVALDYNIVYVALPHIGTSVGFSGASLQWVVSAYAIGFGGFLLLGGRAVDRLGPRRMFLAGLALFGAACLAGGFAHNPASLITARAVQGLGAALLSPATLALLSRSYAEGAARNRALAVWGAAGSGGLSAGALLGGVLTDAWGWRSVLFVMVPLALAALGAALRLLDADGPRQGGVADFDLPGAATVTVGAALLVFGLVSGPQYGWASPRCLVGLAVGVLLLAAFLAIEQHSADPLVAVTVLRRHSLLTAMAVILVFQSTLGGGYYLFTTYLQDGRSYTPLETGLAFLPLTIVAMAASLRLTPALLGRWGVRPTLTFGMIVNGVGVAGLGAAMTTRGSFWAALPGLLIWGVGGGITFPAMFVAAATGVESSEQGVASALAVTAQQIGGALGLAVLIAIAGTGRSKSTPTPSGLIDGLRHAGWAAGAASIAGGLLVLVFVLRQRRTTTL
jgi:EmrB/QacA subfamily drug resistance transporter